MHTSKNVKLITLPALPCPVIESSDEARKASQSYFFSVDEDQVLDPTNALGDLEDSMKFLGVISVSTLIARINEPPLGGDVNLCTEIVANGVIVTAERDIFPGGKSVKDHLVLSFICLILSYLILSYLILSLLLLSSFGLFCSVLYCSVQSLQVLFCLVLPFLTFFCNIYSRNIILSCLVHSPSSIHGQLKCYPLHHKYEILSHNKRICTVPTIPFMCPCYQTDILITMHVFRGALHGLWTGLQSLQLHHAHSICHTKH